MRILFLDFETKDTKNKKGRRDPSPFLPENYLVSYGWKTRGYEKDTRGYAFFRHTNSSCIDTMAAVRLQQLLDGAELVVAFNAKFELEWLLEAGFRYKRQVYCPMVVEYILARGQHCQLDLASCCSRRGAPPKLGSLIDDLWDQGLSFDAMPFERVVEYGNRDVECAEGLYDIQLALLEEEENASLKPTVQMCNEFIWCLVEMERNGIYIDTKALALVEEEFTNEYKQLRSDLENIAQSLIGDSKINLDSPEQLSQLIYSRKVKDKHEWKELFRIGTDARGKRLKAPRMSPTKFVAIVKEETEVIRQTSARHCTECDGKGRLFNLLTKAGRPFKNAPLCKQCDGRGYSLLDTGKIAGFRIAPRGPFDCAAGGFATDKDTLREIANRLKQLPEEGRKSQLRTMCIEFIEKYIKYSAIGTYLTTFVEGIKRGANDNHILHTKLNQCVTATGRLSSTDPNFQNMPRALTFPIRKVVRSRWDDGKVIEVDFSQLEFRAAAYIYQCQTAIQTILEHVDVHAFTASIIECSRQDAKPHTFKPLYGGTSGTEKEQRYYKAFRDKYVGITEGQNRDIQTVLKTGRLTIPSGRQYDFIGTKRTPSGYITNTTQICNYPVQGFATADIVPIVIIELRKAFSDAHLRSLIILTVHDSIVVDCEPTEIRKVLDIINSVFTALPVVIRARYGIDVNVPLEWETKMGDNWYDMRKAA